MSAGEQERRVKRVEKMAASTDFSLGIAKNRVCVFVCMCIELTHVYVDRERGRRMR